MASSSFSSSSSSSSILLLVVLCTCCSFEQMVAGQSLACDFPNDNTCNSTNDGICDSVLGDNPLPGCEMGDCVDCDICKAQFSHNCAGCLAADGCVWCPGDATCYNSNAYAFSQGFIASCTAPEDYVTGAGGGTCTRQENEFNDPLYMAQQWVYDLINVVPVWKDSVFGTGVRVRINDGGVDNTHSEFEGRFDVEASCTEFAPNNDDDMSNSRIDHGTGVASIVGAASDNNECSVGVAPGVSLSSCNILEQSSGGNGPDERYSFLIEKVDTFDISQNSYGLLACEGDNILISRNRTERKRRERRILQDGSCPFTFEEPRIADRPCEVCGDFNNLTLTSECETAILRHCSVAFENDVEACLDVLDLLLGNTLCSYDKLPDSAIDAFTTGITQGRDGKGIIYIFASGNSYAQGDDVNFGALTNSRFTITVGSVGKDGKHASYSTPGAALVVSAPGGDHEFVSNHVGAVVGGGCGDIGVGTSFACPVVSGVVALMLEVNSNLGWRDVQGILAKTSTMVVDDDDDDTRIVNAAGFNHSNFYGFGIVNAEQAVAAARTWRRYPQELMLVGESGIVNLEIPDTPFSPVFSTSEVFLGNGDEDFLTESVELLLDLQHFSRGDLEIVLTSPQGTSSTLHPGARLENTQLDADDRWRLMTVRNWGENPAGEWSLSIRDLRSGDAAVCVNEPYYVVASSGQEITCRFLAQEHFCANGTVDNGPTKFGDPAFQPLLDETSDGITLQQACCACGGGFERENFTDMLRQWRLIVHGHIDNNGETPSPSSGPSEQPSEIPSPMPSRSPSPPPSEKPTPGPVQPRFTAEPFTVSKDRSPEERTEFVITIVATAAVAILVGCCCYYALKPPAPIDYSRPGLEQTASSAELI